MDSSEKNTALLRSLAEAVDSLRSSEGWLRWLETASRFRTYSFRNQLLILAQRPDATQVAGYRTWQSLGRQVRRGERGLAIFAPCVRKVATEDADDAERRLVGFRVVRVFDVSQTQGVELPALRMPEVVTPDASLYDRLVAVATALGFEVATIAVSVDEARGWFERDKGRITIVEAYPLASRTRTLLHELGHALDDDDASDTRAERELVAESVAFLVGTHHGVDLRAASTLYAASWGGDSRRFEALAERVLIVASRLDDAVEAAEREAVA